MLNAMSTRISIAMCTYNGEQFLSAQLASVLEQSRLPDEMVVCDDASRDRTLQILHEFASRAPFPVRVFQNAHNIGSTRNFELAISLCRGDFIALSDQDDIWHPSRLARSEEELTDHPEVGLVFSDADLIDDQGNAVGSTLWEASRFTEPVKHGILSQDYSLCLRLRFVTGATVMFRRERIERCLPVGDTWIHDEWLAAATPLLAEVRPIDERLISYRRHAAQQIGPSSQQSLASRAKDALQMLFNAEFARRMHWNKIEAAANKASIFCDCFRNRPLDKYNTPRLAAYQKFVDHLTYRLALPSNRFRRPVPIMIRLSEYRKYAGVGTVIKDILLKR